jgi:mono/diheme cytochrome c family protein
VSRIVKLGLFAVVALAALVALWLLLAPPRWWLNTTKRVDLTNAAATGEQLARDYDCQGCHRIAGEGALKAPILAGVTERLDPVSLRLWLLNPRAIKSNTAMPNFRLSDSEVEALVAYLYHMDGKD